MPVAANLDWLYHLLGYTLAAFAIVLLLWSLFRDRGRGGRRCPKCWYDMSGSPGLKCPECGREATSEGNLHRTRRSWRLAVLAIILLLGSHIVAEVPAIGKRGWWAAVPRPVLALLIPITADHVGIPSGTVAAPGYLEAEIRHRFFQRPWRLRSLWPGERLALRLGARQALSRPGSFRREQLASQVLALVTAPSSTAEPAILTLARSGAAYANCTSYRDSGSVLGSIGQRDERPFITAFARDGGDFRFEFLSCHPFETKFSSRYVVWGSESSYKSWWTIQPSVASHTDLLMALAGPTGVSGGSASTIPMQLTGSSWFMMIKQPSRTGTEEFDGHMCHVIRGTDFVGMPVDIWIDAQNFAIRKIHQHWEHPSITVYRPEFDTAISPELFEFNPTVSDHTSLGDGEVQSLAFRQLAGNPRKGAIPVPESKRQTR